MATVGQIISRSRRMLRGSKREPFRTLAEAVPVDQTFLPLTTAPGNAVAIDDYACVDAEIMLVVGVDDENKRIEVVRGVDDTPQPLEHLPGDRVELGWRWFTADLLGWFADEVRSWGDGIFVPVDVSLSAGIASRSINLPLERYRHDLRLRRKVTGREWTEVPSNGYRVEQGLPVEQFSDGAALVLSAAANTAQLIFTYAQALDLTDVEDLDTDLEAIGIGENLRDAVTYGIAWRALAGDEASRLDDGSQPEPRTAEEVEPGDTLRAASAYKAIRDLRLAEEERRLRTLYPMKVA